MLKALKKRNMRLYMNVWPHLQGPGLRVRLDALEGDAIVEMKMRFWNANY